MANSYNLDIQLAYFKQEAPTMCPHACTHTVDSFKVNSQICLITNFFSCKSQPLSNSISEENWLSLATTFSINPRLCTPVFSAVRKSRTENGVTCHLGNILAVGMFSLSSWQFHLRDVSLWLPHSTAAVTLAWCLWRNTSALQVCLENCPQFITRETSLFDFNQIKFLEGFTSQWVWIFYVIDPYSSQRSRVEKT